MCDAMQCRVEGGGARAEDWRDFNSNCLPACQFLNTSGDFTYAANDEGPCMGIEVNIWERAEVYIILLVLFALLLL